MSSSRDVPGNENGKNFPEKGKDLPSQHDRDCDWHTDQYPWECTCGVYRRDTPLSSQGGKTAGLDNVGAVRHD